MSDLKKLSRGEKLMILVITLNTFATTLASAFINVYLYTYTSSMAVMALYTAIRISLFPIFFTIGGRMSARRKSFDLCFALGFFFFIVQLSAVLLLKDQFGLHPGLVYLIAVITGTGEGFKWLAINSLNQLISTPDKRATYVAQMGICNNIANVLAPSISTLLITTAVSDNAGYLRIFAGTLGIYVVLIILSFAFRMPSTSRPFTVLPHLRVTTTDHQWRYVLISTFLYGLRDSLDLMLTGLLLYTAVGSSGATYSKLLVVFAVAAVIAHRLSTRLMRRSNRLRFYQTAGVLMSTATIALILFPNMYGVVYYGLVNAMAGAFFANAYSIIIGNAMFDYSASENIVGRVVAKETSQSVGRVLGMLMVYLMYVIWPDSYLTPAVIILSCASTVLAIYAHCYHSARDRAKAAAAK